MGLEERQHRPATKSICSVALRGGTTREREREGGGGEEDRATPIHRAWYHFWPISSKSWVLIIVRFLWKENVTELTCQTNYVFCQYVEER